MTSNPTAQGILVLNSGSSSLKYQLLDFTGQVRAHGLIERIEAGSAVGDHASSDYASAIDGVLDSLPADVTVVGVGHRVVHGGFYKEAKLLTPEVIGEIERLCALAPLHNPPALEGIRASMRRRPGVPHVAVFDTAFHATMPPRAYRYAISEALYQENNGELRRYGAHGTSHAYMARRVQELHAHPLKRIITLHLGNGASAAAILDGVSVDTSMGFTPLEGLVMGTRSGDIDAGLVMWLSQKYGPDNINAILNKQSGLKGMSGLSNDLRDLHAAGTPEAQLALDVMVYRLIKYVGAYTAALGGLDALVFTGGIGENDAVVRAQVIAGLHFFGLVLDEEANNVRGQERRITTANSLPAYVIPANEEGEIARQVREVAGI